MTNQGLRQQLTALVLLGFISNATSAELASADPIPNNLPSGIEPEFTTRLFFKSEPWLLYAEANGSWQTDSRQLRSLFLGSYFRVLDNLKVGAFYKGVTGLRHDEDWIKTADGSWKWNDTSSRLEHEIVLDATPRLELDFLPGENWVGELKSRYFYNFFNSQSAIVLRPGLTYFWMRGGKPFINFFLQYEMWFPIGFGHKAIYETWGYLGFLHHLNHSLQLGAYGALKTQYWTSTDAFTSLTGDSYSVQGSSTVLGLLMVIQLGKE